MLGWKGKAKKTCIYYGISLQQCQDIYDTLLTISFSMCIYYYTTEAHEKHNLAEICFISLATPTWSWYWLGSMKYMWSKRKAHMRWSTRLMMMMEMEYGSSFFLLLLHLHGKTQLESHSRASISIQ